MNSFEELAEIVKSETSNIRFQHILGVVDRAVEYAKFYGVNIADVKISAILHDYTKEYSIERNKEILKRYNYELDQIEEKNPNLIHGKSAGLLAKYEFGFSDDISNAISYHTTGRANMSILEKIIYLADATEPNRDYSKNENELTLNEVVELIKKDIDEGLIYVLKWTMKSLIRRNLLIHPDSVEAYNYYLDKKINK